MSLLDFTFGARLPRPLPGLTLTGKLPCRCGQVLRLSEAATTAAAFNRV